MPTNKPVRKDFCARRRAGGLRPRLLLSQKAIKRREPGDIVERRGVSRIRLRQLP